MKRDLKIVVILVAVVIAAAVLLRGSSADAQTKVVTAGQQFKNIKVFFLKKLQATSPSTAASLSPRISATAPKGKEKNK